MGYYSRLCEREFYKKTDKKINGVKKMGRRRSGRKSSSKKKSESSRPIISLRDKNIQIAMWKPFRDGDDPRISIQKSRKDRDDKWQNERVGLYPTELDRLLDLVEELQETEEWKEHVDEEDSDDDEEDEDDDGFMEDEDEEEDDDPTDEFDEDTQEAWDKIPKKIQKVLPEKVKKYKKDKIIENLEGIGLTKKEAGRIHKALS